MRTIASVREITKATLTLDRRDRNIFRAAQKKRTKRIGFWAQFAKSHPKQEVQSGS